MANWKLRKDKTPTAASGTSDAPDAAEAAAPAEPQEAEHQEAEHQQAEHQASSLPAFDAGPDFADLSDNDVKASSANAAYHGDGLTLVDYSDDDALDNASLSGASLETLAHHAQVFDAATPDFGTDDFETPSFETSDFEPAAFAMPPPIEAERPMEAAPVMEAAPTEAPPVIPTDEAGDFQQRLRTGRFEASELAAPPSGFPTPGIPSVAPFVLDAPPPAAPPEAPPQLVVHLGRLAAAFAVTKDVTTIGRPDSALHYYPDVEVELDDAVSRRHAEVVKRGEDYYVVDTGSTNGTRLNGEALPPHQERRLTRGDRIKVGERTEIVFG